MSVDYICKLTAKVNELTNAVINMQENAGLSSDNSFQTTLTGRIKALEESVVSSDPKETNISRMMVEHDIIVVDGKIQTEYAPIGGCVNREIMVQNPDDLEEWEVVGQVTFVEDVGSLGTNDYDGWAATVSYIYATKITLEEFTFTDAVREIIKDMSAYVGTVYRIIYTITPTGSCTLHWENNAVPTDTMDEVISTEHIRTVDEEDFNHTLYITGTAEVKIEVRNRIA